MGPILVLFRHPPVHVASPTFSRRANRCWSRSWSRSVRLKRSTYRVLIRFSRLDVLDSHACGLAPLCKALADEFGTVIDTQDLRQRRWLRSRSKARRTRRGEDRHGVHGRAFDPAVAGRTRDRQPALALFPLVARGRWIAAFAFGLIHSFGFAGALQDLGLPAGSLALSLAGFNIGVELGQLAIVAAFLPLAFAARATWPTVGSCWTGVRRSSRQSHAYGLSSARSICRCSLRWRRQRRADPQLVPISACLLHWRHRRSDPLRARRMPGETTTSWNSRRPTMRIFAWSSLDRPRCPA
jgi:HupE / UreJ protein